jgi:hypothetical protein
MKKCINCDYKFTCDKANDKSICEKYMKSEGKTVTKLDEVDNGYYKFSKVGDCSDI